MKLMREKDLGENKKFPKLFKLSLKLIENMNELEVINEDMLVEMIEEICKNDNPQPPIIFTNGMTEEQIQYIKENNNIIE